MVELFSIRFVQSPLHVPRSLAFAENAIRKGFQERFSPFFLSGEDENLEEL